MFLIIIINCHEIINNGYEDYYKIKKYFFVDYGEIIKMTNNVFGLLYVIME